MAIDANDMAYIRQVLDAVYVMQSDCDDKRDEINKKLSNEKFVANAPEAVVALERKKKSDSEEKIAALKETLAELKG